MLKFFNVSLIEGYNFSYLSVARHKSVFGILHTYLYLCFAAKGWLQGRAAKLLRARRKSWYNEAVSHFALQLTEGVQD